MSDLNERLTVYADRYNKGELIAFSSAAKLLGLRQHNQLHLMRQHKRVLAPYLIGALSQREKEKQIEVGESFVCGYRPGVIASEQQFQSIASHTRLSAPVLKLARTVLVDGVPLSALSLKETSVNSKQEVDQACVTICRSMVGVEAYRSNAFETALKHVSSIVTAIDPFIVLSVITGDSVKMVKSFKERVEVPSFSEAAFYSLVATAPTSLITEVELLLLSVLNTAWELQYRFNISQAQFVRLLSSLQLGSTNSALTLVLQPKETATPYTLLDLISVDAFLRDLANKKHPLVYLESDNPFQAQTNVYDFYAIEEKLANGKTLKDVGYSVSKKTGGHVTAIHSVYKRWKAKSKPQKYWLTSAGVNV